MRVITVFALLATLAACEDPAPPEMTGQDIVDACIATGCTVLNLDGHALEGYSQLAALTQVEVLMISYTNFADLAQIAPLTGLRELHIGSTDVTDLAGLSAFPNLTLLHAQDLDVVDYRPIGQLKSLEELALGHGTIPSLAFVQDLPALRRLSLNGVYTLDLSGIRAHPRLEEIALSNSGSLDDDLTPLLTLPSLRAVTLDDYDNADWQALIERMRARGVVVTQVEIIPVC